MASSTRPPDYLIRGLDKQTEDGGEIGAVWVKDDGSLHIKFNPFVTVPTGSRFALTGFLNDGSRSAPGAPREANFRVVDIPDEEPRRAKRVSRRRA